MSADIRRSSDALRCPTRCSLNHRGRPAATRSTSALARSLVIAAAACALAAAPAAAAYVLRPATAGGDGQDLDPSRPAAASATAAKFAWKTTGTGVKTTCRLDSGAYASCSRSHSYSKLKDGMHTFTVRAKGGATTRSATYKWRVDTVAPTAPTVSGGTGTLDDRGRRRSRRPDRPTRAEAASPPTSTAARPNGGTTWSAAAAGTSANGHRQRHDLGAVPRARQGRQRLGLGAGERRPGRRGDGRHRCRRRSPS